MQYGAVTSPQGGCEWTDAGTEAWSGWDGHVPGMVRNVVGKVFEVPGAVRCLFKV